MELINRPVTFELPELELVRPGAIQGVRTNAFYGKELENACLAQVDFLGFTSLLLRAGGKAPELVQAIYQTTETHARIGARTNGDDGEPTIAIFQYADSINIVAREDGPNGISPVVRAVAYLIASLHGRGFPARAGITMGEVWAVSRARAGGLTGDFVSGPAVARAHEVETGQDWAGGIVDPTCEGLMQAPELRELRRTGWLVEAHVPVRVGSERRVDLLSAVNWPRVLHVPNDDWLAGAMACDNPPDEGEEGPWRKRRAAVEFYDRHGLGRNALHPDDMVAWLVTPSGKHVPLVPVALFF